MSRRHTGPLHSVPRVLPLAVALLGVAPALAAGGGSGLSLTPPLLEHAAVPGNVGSLKISNGTGQPINISVSAHPWIQGLSGISVPNQRATLATVRPSVVAFTLANGASRMVSATLLQAPKGGSLYGNIDVTGIPAQAHAPNAVTVGYRLIASLRLDPLHPVRAARAGRASVSGSRGHGTVVLAVHNSGNTIEPISGSVHITGARGAESGSIAAARVLPGSTVNVPVYTLAGSLAAGSYKLVASLTQGGHRLLTAQRTFTIR